MQTPSPAPLKRVFSRAASVCSQRHPGSVKSWKSRCDDDEIPSDESDDDGRRAFGPNMRTRIRKRRAISARPLQRQPLSSGISWMSASKCMRTQSVCAPSSSCSNVTTERNVKKALFSSSFNPSKSPSQVRPGPSHGMKSFSTHSYVGKQRVGTMKSPPRRISKDIRSVPSSNPDPVAHKTSSPNDWVLFSVWHPAWDVIWKCDNGKRPLTQNQYFRKLITEVLTANMTPHDISATIDLKLIKVQDVEEDSQGKLNIIGGMEVESNRGRHGKRKKYKPVKWNPAPALLGRLLAHVVSASDLIVQYKCSPTVETEKSKLCFIHVTPKDGKPVDNFELSKMGAQVSMFNINYDYYWPKVIKCVPFKLTATKKTIQEKPINVEATSPRQVNVAEKATVASKNLASYVFGSPGPSPVSSPGPDPGTAPEVVAVITDEQQAEGPLHVVSEIINTQSLSPSSERIEGMEISEREKLLIVCRRNPLPCENEPLNEKNDDTDFNLASFLSKGEFIPGSLRPKVKKPNKQYVYHTLEELAEKINVSINDDLEKGLKPSMMVKHQCNAYGIVVEVKNPGRHENAYFVRISDETMRSVLLRIHAGVDQSPGPRIEVGNIIRVHRLTAQYEWDSDVSENTIVLSTAAHHNYVLFEKSDDQFQFYYNTCAKTVTLSDIDYRRVGELYAFKSKRDFTSNKEGPLPLAIEQGEIAPVARHELPEVAADSVLSLLQTSRDSDGICDSDLASPGASDVSIGEDDTQSKSGSILDESRIQAISNSRSDESFFSATSDVDLAGDNENRLTTRFQHPADTSIKVKTVPGRNNSRNGDFDYFKDLKFANKPLNLLGKIVSLNEYREGVWCLILEDVERTVPSLDFKHPQSAVSNPSEFHLAVNIKNGIGLEKRNLLSMLVEYQGSDELFRISNVKSKGAQPPYTLEIDGNSCDIKKHNELHEFYGLNETWSSRISAPSSTADPHDAMDEELPVIENENSDGGVATDSRLNNSVVSVPNENSDDDISVIQVIPWGSSQSNFVTASHTPSHSPATNERQDSHKRSRTPAPTVTIQTSNPIVHDGDEENPDDAMDGELQDVEDEDAGEEPWTGRLKGRRKPRQHYQSEDSFEC